MLTILTVKWFWTVSWSPLYNDLQGNSGRVRPSCKHQSCSKVGKEQVCFSFQSLNQRGLSRNVCANS